MAIDGWHKRAAEVVESWNDMLEIRSELQSMTNDHTGASEEGDRLLKTIPAAKSTVM